MSKPTKLSKAMQARMRKYLNYYSREPKIQPIPKIIPETTCLHCGHFKKRIVKISIVWDEEEKRFIKITTYNFEQICTNINCWTYLDLSKLNTWKII